MEVNMEDQCFICELKLLDETNVTQVKSKGVQSFILASEKRLDGKAKYLKGKESVKVHEQCRRRYTNEKLIAAYMKKGDAGSSRLRSEVEIFSFRTGCFLCGLGIPEDYETTRLRRSEQSTHRSNKVFTVRSLTVLDNVRKLASRHDNEWGRTILLRLEPITDLVAADGQYHLKCMKRLYLRRKNDEPQKRGPFASEVDSAMQSIYEYMEKNEEQCQFSIQELIDQVGPERFRPSAKTVKTHILNKYGDDVVIAINARNTPIVCFKNTGYKLLTDAWYEQRSLNVQKERLRIVETAAKILIEDIRSQVYETTDYPPPDYFLQDVDTFIPETLKKLTDTLIKSKKKGDCAKLNTKSCALAHSIISGVRPRSFISPLQVGLATYLYKKFGSRKLVEVLSSLGFCATYKEAVRFEVSAIMRPPFHIESGSFSQFVFDNADFNTQTIDGHDTFHSMGGIQCVTPKSAITSNQVIPRLPEIPDSAFVGSFGAVQLKHFEMVGPGLSSLMIKDVIKQPSQSRVTPSVYDLLWLYGKANDVAGIPGWSSFMEVVFADLPFQQTYVACLPFVNASPTNRDTVHTALLHASEKSKSAHQAHCFTTFDQPLYIKAREIVEGSRNDPNLKNVIVRLGGFHLLLSFLGAIGFIMNGSGLKEMIQTIYAPNSTEKILTGHAYARAIRAHTLAHAALGSRILESMELSPDIKLRIEEILCDCDRSSIRSANSDEQVTELKRLFDKKLESLEQQGPTSKLWIQYFTMITLVKQFIAAERMGNWELHLATVARMLPYFHASGHYLYAKCAHLYLQDMQGLEEIMDPDDYEKFTNGGGFTIRRTDKFWSGTWTDMTIEQTLMRTMKTAGGLTHGRGVSEGVLARWTMGMSSLQRICEEIEDFTLTATASSEQNSDGRQSRASRDNADLEKLEAWVREHNPFRNSSDLISVSSGLVADDRINCHMSEEIGTAGISSIVGSDFKTVKFKRSDRVQTLAILSSSIKVGDDKIAINATTLFQRVSVAKQSDEQLQEYLTYELAAYPLSLFVDGGMRKTTKSTLYKIFTPLPQDTTILESCTYVVDGGYLLHRVVWPCGANYKKICDGYVEFVKSKYSPRAVIVFDGYPQTHNEMGTKSAERARRGRKSGVNEIIFSEKMVPLVSQSKFLTNDKNKNRLIAMLMTRFTEENIPCKQASEDGDTEIIQTALEITKSNTIAVVVGEDIDLLVILLGLSNTPFAYFLKPGKCTTSSQLYSANDSELGRNLMFLHAMSGCDTTSAFYGQGKMKFVHMLKKNPQLQQVVDIFINPQASREDIIQAGLHFLIHLYGCTEKKPTPLNVLRYRAYRKVAFKTSGNIASLPPTEDAAGYHCLRVYHQVQVWLGNHKFPEEWGWRKTPTGLAPIPTGLPPAPESLLRQVFCKCKTACTGKKCGCRKSGMYCSPLCTSCDGECENVQPFIGNDKEEEEEEEEEEVDEKTIGNVELLQGSYQQKNDANERPSPKEDTQPGPSKRAKRS